MRFEIDFLETEDADSIVAELKRIAALLGKTNVSALEVDTYGRVHYHIVVKRFGSLLRALEEAGLRCSRHKKATDEELLTRVTNLWAITKRDSGRRPITSERRRWRRMGYRCPPLRLPSDSVRGRRR